MNPSSPPGDFSDSNADPDGDEYTNLEDYLNWMAQPHVECVAGSFVDIDLHSLSRGFTNSRPVYTFLEVTHGTVTLLDGRYARFTPTTDTNALGGFTFTVTDAMGYRMSRQVNVRIMRPPPPRLAIRRAGGTLRLGITGQSGHTITVQTSADLSHWMDWTTLTGNGATQWVPVEDASSPSQRFFRARLNGTP